MQRLSKARVRERRGGGREELDERWRGIGSCYYLPVLIQNFRCINLTRRRGMKTQWIHNRWQNDGRVPESTITTDICLRQRSKAFTYLQFALIKADTSRARDKFMRTNITRAVTIFNHPECRSHSTMQPAWMVIARTSSSLGPPQVMWQAGIASQSISTSSLREFARACKGGNQGDERRSKRRGSFAQQTNIWSGLGVKLSREMALFLLLHALRLNVLSFVYRLP